MDEARFIRRRTFRAWHHYGKSEWSMERNRAVFGLQTEPHEHQWTVEISLVGSIDAETGFSVDLPTVDETLDAVIGGWADADLNSVVAPVAEGSMMPTTEALAAFVFRAFSSAFPGPAQLESVSVFESGELGATFPASAGYRPSGGGP